MAGGTADVRKVTDDGTNRACMAAGCLYNEPMAHQTRTTDLSTDARLDDRTRRIYDRYSHNPLGCATLLVCLGMVHGLISAADAGIGRQPAEVKAWLSAIKPAGALGDLWAAESGAIRC